MDFGSNTKPRTKKFQSLAINVPFNSEVTRSKERMFEHAETVLLDEEGRGRIGCVAMGGHVKRESDQTLLASLDQNAVREVVETPRIIKKFDSKIGFSPVPQ